MKQLRMERKKKAPASGGGSFRSLALKVFFEKLQCSAPGFLGCLGVIAFGLGIIVKGMLGTRIDFVGVRLVVFFHGLLRSRDSFGNSRIFLTIVRQHRCLNIFYQIQGVWTCSVIYNYGLKSPNPCCHRKAHPSAPAKPYNTKLICLNFGESSEIAKACIAVFNNSLGGGQFPDIGQAL